MVVEITSGALLWPFKCDYGGIDDVLRHLCYGLKRYVALPYVKFLQPMLVQSIVALC